MKICLDKLEFQKKGAGPKVFVENLLSSHTLCGSYEYVVYTYSSTNRGFSIRKLVDIYIFLKREEIDLLHCGGTMWSGLTLALAARLQGIPVVMSVHGLASHNLRLTWFKSVLYHLLDFATLSLADDIIVVSSYLSELNVIKRFFSSRVSVIYNMVPEYKAFISLDTFEVKDRFKLVYAGRLVYDKGLHDIIEFISKSSYRELLHFTILGEGPYKDVLKDLVNSYGLQETVEFLGYHNDVRSIIVNCSAFIIMSYHETLSIAAIEAMSVGKPVMARPVGGLKEVVADGISGYFIESQKDFDTAIKDMTNPAIYKEKSKCAYNRYLSLFSNGTIEKKWDKLYNRYSNE